MLEDWRENLKELFNILWNMYICCLAKKNKQENRETNNMASSRQSAQSTAHSHALPLWHNDFKIAGQISEPGQKDQLTFSRQI